MTPPRTRAVVNQFYGADILQEYVIRGNAAVLKCSIPSFVTDFVRVESWIDELGAVLQPPTDNNYGVPTAYMWPTAKHERAPHVRATNEHSKPSTTTPLPF